ncbi:MAG: SDR family oxidoreductase [Pseudorhodobacter sp.]|nr:SDR family oxidoreductase [Rhizobacter sp.]
MTAPVAFITGASSGIGQAMALRFYQAGYRLALVARRSTELQSWVDEQGWSADSAVVFGADVRDAAVITAAGRACIDALGLPDVVVACAGLSIGMDTAEFADLAVMRTIYETNNLGTAATFQPFVRAMCQRGSGRLVGIASVNGIRGIPGHGAYCSSKAAVISYLESLRGECRPFGVKVVTLSPGYVKTPLTRANPYNMPFALEASDFANRAFQAIEAGTSYRVIPWQMGVLAKLLRMLPNPVFDRVLASRPRKKRQGE